MIFILSAEFGLISSDFPIPWYDHRMNATRAEMLQPGVERKLRKIVAEVSFREVFVCMGRVYQRALPDFASMAPARLPVRSADGTIGYQLAALHDWLYGQPPTQRTLVDTMRGGDAVLLHGINLAVTVEQVLGSGSV